MDETRGEIGSGCGECEEKDVGRGGGDGRSNGAGAGGDLRETGEDGSFKGLAERDDPPPTEETSSSTSSLSGTKSGGNWGSHWSRAASMSRAAASSSARREEILVGDSFAETAALSSFFSARRPASRWMMGQSVVDIPKSVSTLFRGETGGAPSGERGWRHSGAGVVERGAVPLDNAVMTS